MEAMTYLVWLMRVIRIIITILENPDSQEIIKHLWHWLVAWLTA
jgi:hypothetical protein